MASDKWKPLYEFEVSFFTQIGLFLGFILSLVLIGGGGVLISVGIMSSHVPSYAASAFVLTVGFSLLYLVYGNSSSTIKRRMERHGIETYCKKDGLIQVRTASQKMGLFNAGGYVIVEPEYRNIVFMPHFYLLENERGQWGAYNASLSKMVVECKYETIKVDDNKNVTVEKDGIRYTYSPYGSLIHKVNAQADNLVNHIVGKL